MITKRSMWVLIGFFIIAAWLLGFTIEAQAETMKCKVARVVTKDETMPVSDGEGHILGMQISEGAAFFENGDIANLKTEAIYDSRTGKDSQAISYVFFTFEDGSSIIIRNEYRQVTDPSGKISTTAAGEIIKGTGRFEAIKGTFSTAGKALPSVKGEANKYTLDATITYTLPPK